MFNFGQVGATCAGGFPLLAELDDQQTAAGMLFVLTARHAEKNSFRIARTRTKQQLKNCPSKKLSREKTRINTKRFFALLRVVSRFFAVQLLLFFHVAFVQSHFRFVVARFEDDVFRVFSGHGFYAVGHAALFGFGAVGSFKKSLNVGNFDDAGGALRLIPKRLRPPRLSAVSARVF